MDGYLKIKTKIDNKDIDKGISELEDKIKKLQTDNSNQSDTERKLQEQVNKYRQLIEKQKEYSNKLKELKKLPKISPVKAGDYLPVLMQTEHELQSINSEIEKQAPKIEKVEEKLKRVKQKQIENNAKISEYKQKIEQINLKNIQNSVDNVGNKLSSHMRKIGKMVLGIVSISAAWGAVNRTMNMVASYNQQVSTNLDYMKYCIASSITPVVERLVKLLYTVLSYINAIASAWFGINLFGNASVKNFKKMQNSAGSTAKSAKEIQKSLQGFDEMNILQKDGSTEVGGGGGGVSSPSIDLSGIDVQSLEFVEKLKNIFNDLKQIVQLVWDSEPIQAFINAATSYGEFLFKFWSSIGNNIWNNMKITWENISNNLSETWRNLSTLWTEFWQDIDKGIQIWGKPIIDGVTEVFNSIWEDAIDPLIQIITKSWADFSGILLDLWRKHGEPLIDNIGEFVTKTIDLFQKVWDDILEPIITPFLETLGWLWDEHISGMIEKAGDFVGKLINDALEIYNKFIEPLITYLIEKLSPAWSYICELITGVLGTIIAVVSDVFGGIFEILGGIIDFITGVFTGNWSKAWEGIKSIFKGIVDTLVGIFKAPINLIIDAINAFIAGLNKIQIPDWVPGIGGRGLNITKIPKLAKGAVISQPTQAIIGEAGKEAVVPLENNLEWLDIIADKLSSKIGNGGNVNVYLDGRLIQRQISKREQQLAFATNGR